MYIYLYTRLNINIIWIVDGWYGNILRCNLCKSVARVNLSPLGYRFHKNFLKQMYKDYQM